MHFALLLDSGKETKRMKNLTVTVIVRAVVEGLLSPPAVAE
jgi:hypothetical protein